MIADTDLNRTESTMERPGTLTESDDNLAAIRAAGRLTVYELFAEQALRQPGKTALKDKARSFSYRTTRRRVDALASRLESAGIRPGDRIAVLSENRIEYIELHLAAARIGAIVACQNWRLRKAELEHCVGLVTPGLLLYSPRFAETGTALAEQFGIAARSLGEDYEAWIEEPAGALPPPAQDTEAGLLILYTSGTTGPAKAALISQRAIIARMTLLQTDLDVEPEDGFLAWSPMFHMGGTEHSISTLAMGGTVYVADGFDIDFIVETIGTARLGWLILVPATIERLLEALDARRQLAPPPPREAAGGGGAGPPAVLLAHRGGDAASSVGRAAGSYPLSLLSSQPAHRGCGRGGRWLHRRHPSRACRHSGHSRLPPGAQPGQACCLEPRTRRGPG